MASERTKAEKKFMRKFQQSTCIGFIDDVEIDFQERAKQQIQHIRDLIQEATHSLERELYEMREARHGR